MAEKLSVDLAEIVDESIKDKIAVHHGSLDKEVRLHVENQLKEKLKGELARMFRHRPRDYWVKLVGKADVCLTPVLDMSEVERDPHLKERNMIVEQEHPQLGKIKSIGMPIKFSRTTPSTPTPPPMSS